MIVHSLHVHASVTCDIVCTDVDEELDVTRAQVVEDGGLVEVGQVSHVIVHVELWRVHLRDVVLLKLFLLQRNTITSHVQSKGFSGFKYLIPKG